MSSVGAGPLPHYAWWEDLVLLRTRGSPRRPVTSAEGTDHEESWGLEEKFEFSRNGNDAGRSFRRGFAIPENSFLSREPAHNSDILGKFYIGVALLYASLRTIYIAQ